MDFYTIKERSTKNGVIEIYPDFKVGRSQDLMIRGRAFYAIWDEEAQMWSTDEYDVQRLVDKTLFEHRKKVQSRTNDMVYVKSMRDFSSGSWYSFKNYLRSLSDNAQQLDEKLTFLNTEVTKTNYVSRRLNYPLEEGPIDAYEELIGTLYNPDEKEKLEWAVGAIIAGDAKDIQKFIVLYGDAGSGKSTFLNIVQKLFSGYYTTFDAKDLTSNNNAFSTEVFKHNPLVAIQHDGDLSRIDDNTKLNSIVSHELMTMNEKYKASYTARVNSFLFMATNKPVKITDAKSGIIRRLIDTKPSGRVLPVKRYQSLVQQIDFELGAIAYHCLDIYRKMGKNYYSNYRPIDMMFQTDVFFNFVESYYHIFKEQDGTTLKQAYTMYKEYCSESSLEYQTPMYKFREELKNYFRIFHEVTRIDGKQIRSYYEGFADSKFKKVLDSPQEHQRALVLDEVISLFDDICGHCPAQYATADEKPIAKWKNVKSKLSDIDTRELHYVQPPINHIVIDFDLVGEDGNKDYEKNLEAANKWPPTYAEFSKSGQGLHLHYYYDGDATQISRVYDEGIEIKIFSGNSSLRRKLTKCNNVPIATLNSGLPLKGEKMINFETVQSERSLRNLIKRNLNKEIHPGTKPSIDFIFKILDDAYKSNLKYDVTDLRPSILSFANNSTNQANYCVKLVSEMKFKSDDPSNSKEDYILDKHVFFDVEVFPNLLVVVWKVEDKEPVRMINPSPKDIEDLLKFKLIGFNCRRYDNHILYARYIGYNNMQLYQLSKKLINNSRNGTFSEAYNLSYADIYEFSSKKQSLKKWELELGITHKELGYSWDEPVVEENWVKVAEYCENDVLATEAVFKSRQQDFVAREILAELSGLLINDTTQNHTAKIIFGKDNKPQDKFEYTELNKMFPGYIFDAGQSTYRGEVVGEGGYVYAEPGMYENVALLDVASMHPTSLILLNMFGPYTKNFEDLVNARLAVKNKDYHIVTNALNGVLGKYLTSEEDAENLSYALKIIINIVYGLTSAKFDNKFRDIRNKDNIVAKRGSLFMIDLKNAVQEKGFTVAHIKTDSIKIPNATQEIIDFVMAFGKDYGYTFEHECTFDKFCLVNDAVYVGKLTNGKWDAVGAQFIHPYVYKTLFSKESLEFKDYVEVKSVQTALYLDFNEGLKEGEHEYRFIGKSGAFCPVIEGAGGGLLMRKQKEDPDKPNQEVKYHAASGTKGYRWLEAEVIKEFNKEDSIDILYYNKLTEDAIKNISNFGNFDWFISDKKQDTEKNDIPWDV